MPRVCHRKSRGSTGGLNAYLVIIVVGALALWQKLGRSLASNLAAGESAYSKTLSDAIAANAANANDSRDTPSGLLAPVGSGAQTPVAPAARPAAAHTTLLAGTSPGRGAGTPSPARSAARGDGTQAASNAPVPVAAPASAPRPAATATPSLPPAERGAIERANDFLVNNSAAQYALGIGSGILQGFTPGGFLAPSPYAESKPYELGRGLGQMAAGVSETFTGLAMVGGGAASTGVGAVGTFTPASPAGAALVAVGVPTTIAGAGVVVHGTTAALGGYQTFINAMSMSDANSGGGGTPPASGGGGPGTKPSAQGQPEALKEGELGPKLGSGGNKDVFAFGPDKAVGVLRDGKRAGDIEKELATLRKLDELGLPTVKARPVTVDGKPAVMYDRLAQGSKDVVRLVDDKMKTVGSSPLLNQRSVADLRAIRQTMIDKQVRVDDLQFLIRRDGRVVIADPLNVAVGQGPSANNLKMIKLLIKAAGGQ